MTQVQEFKLRAAMLGEFDHEELDHMCFMHLKQMTKDFGREGETALKLLDIAEDLLR